ncbi:MAG: antitoxin, RHH family protein [Elusimicrobia bacterium]|nr:antitoxin, RHH family protein [Elusimicrobiota bacterium]
MRQPRIICSVEQPLYNLLIASAKMSGISISLKARDLLKKAMEMEEDEPLLKIAKQRDAAWNCKKAMSHEKFWGLKLKKRAKKCSR